MVEQEIEYKLNGLLEQFLFEENDEYTRKNVHRVLSSYLSGLQIRKKISNYRIYIDSSKKNKSSLNIEVQISFPNLIGNICINLRVKRSI